MMDERAEQPFGVGHWFFRGDFDAGRWHESTLAKPVRFPPIAPALGLLFHLHLAICHQQVAEQQLVSRSRPFVVNRTFNFHPAKDHSWLTVFFSERILPA